MSRYTVTAERTPRWWVLQAVEAPGAISQVSRLDQADEIREAIAFVTGEDESAIEFDLVPVAEFARLAEFRRARAELASVTEQVQRLSSAAVAELQATGLSYRDIGMLMGVSYQRVGQLVGSRGASTSA